MQQLHIRYFADHRGGGCLHVAGEIDLAVHERLRAALHRVLAMRPRRLVVDLAQVTFLDAGGVGVLVQAAAAAQAARIPFRVRGADGIAARVLALAAGWDRATGTLGAMPARHLPTATAEHLRTQRRGLARRVR
ncbi:MULTISPECIES: STAS domain-containing protein [Catellatospora]|uniref:STAS domain-containing protein n=1 Tax=Catellatospora chokoriensis TaxID=310353 RepID=A0A8J3K857_9ACTN|nr:MULTISPECIES: STAS domain-containing protein [Catellatospora]GIF94642.1 hypothetical protein Cch02nite_80860 [Catellatospora chokoriensis]